MRLFFALILFGSGVVYALPLSQTQGTTSVVTSAFTPVKQVSVTMDFSEVDKLESGEAVIVEIRQDAEVLGSATYQNTSATSITNCACWDIVVDVTAPFDVVAYAQTGIQDLETIYVKTYDKVQGPGQSSETSSPGLVAWGGDPAPGIPFGDVVALQNMGLLPRVDKIGRYVAPMTEELRWDGGSGDRHDIGLFPEWHAAYLSGENDHLRDSIIQYSGPMPTSGVSYGHIPNAHWLPYMLTGDAKYIGYMEDTWEGFKRWRNQGYETPFNYYDHSRYLAWPMRTLVQLAWLQQQGLTTRDTDYVKVINDSISYWNEKVINRDPLDFGDFESVFQSLAKRARVLGTSSDGSWKERTTSPWMEGFVGEVLGWSLQLGFTQFKPIAEYQFQHLMLRAGDPFDQTDIPTNWPFKAVDSGDHIQYWYWYPNYPDDDGGTYSGFTTWLYGLGIDEFYTAFTPYRPEKEALPTWSTWPDDTLFPADQSFDGYFYTFTNYTGSVKSWVTLQANNGVELALPWTGLIREKIEERGDTILYKTNYTSNQLAPITQFIPQTNTWVSLYDIDGDYKGVDDQPANRSRWLGYSGAAIDSENGRFYAIGGGHADSYDARLFYVDLYKANNGVPDESIWIIHGQDIGTPEYVEYHDTYTEETITAACTSSKQEGGTWLTNGLSPYPISRHTYDGVVFDNNKVYVGGGSTWSGTNEKMWHTSPTQLDGCYLNAPRDLWSFDGTSGAGTRMENYYGPGDGAGPAFSYGALNPVTNEIQWAHGTGVGRSITNLSTGVTTYEAGSNNFSEERSHHVYDSKRNATVAMTVTGNVGTLRWYRYSDDTVTKTLTTTGAPIEMVSWASGHGLAYNSRDDMFYTIAANGLLSINPETGVVTEVDNNQLNIGSIDWAEYQFYGRLQYWEKHHALVMIRSRAYANLIELDVYQFVVD